MAIKYGSNSITKTIAVPFTYGGVLTSRGDGTKTVGININPTVSGAILTVTGNARIYTDEAGTVGEATSKVLNHYAYGSSPRFFIKLTSGTAKWYVNTKRVNDFLTQQIAVGHENAPKISGDFSNWVTIQLLSLVSRVSFPSDLTKVCNPLMKHLSLSTAYNEGRVTGDASGAIHTTTLSLKDYISRIAPNLMYVTADLSLYDSHPFLELVDDFGEAMDIVGDLTPVDPSFWYGSGSSKLSGNASAWTECCYVETSGAFTATTIAGMTKCGYFQPNVIMTETQVNQFLADLRANVDVVKGYGPSETSRTFDLSGAIGTAAPTGQGLIDKQWLIDWVGSSGQRNNVITR